MDPDEEGVIGHIIVRAEPEPARGRPAVEDDDVDGDAVGHASFQGVPELGVDLGLADVRVAVVLGERVGLLDL